MTPNGIFQILLYTAVIIALAKPMGAFMAKVFAGERTWLHRIFRPVETAIYKICGIDEAAEQHWTRYAGSVLAFSAVSLLFTYLILRLQQWFPWNPAGLANVGEHLSWNTAVSFTSNTNWQSYVARADHELSQRDDRSGHPQLLLGGRRNRRRHRRRPRILAPLHQNSRQLLGGFHPRYTLHPAADFHRRRPPALLARRHPEPEPVHQSHHARRHGADHRTGTRGVAGSHQDARHQRRRLLQRQFGASL